VPPDAVAEETEETVNLIVEAVVPEIVVYVPSKGAPKPATTTEAPTAIPCAMLVVKVTVPAAADALDTVNSLRRISEAPPPPPALVLLPVPPPFQPPS
jgi:hypothetical protein